MLKVAIDTRKVGAEIGGAMQEAVDGIGRWYGMAHRFAKSSDACKGVPFRPVWNAFLLAQVMDEAKGAAEFLDAFAREGGATSAEAAAEVDTMRDTMRELERAARVAAGAFLNICATVMKADATTKAGEPESGAVTEATEGE